MKHYIFLIGFALLNINILSAQWELVESKTKQELLDELNLPQLVVQYDIDSYRVEYPTTNIDGTAGMASGLLTIPRSSDFQFPVLVLQHGTVGSRDEVPSELDGGYTLGQIFSTLGFTVIQADYLGLGINPGIHPYVHADSEAWVALDFMEHVMENYETNAPNRYLNDQVFVTGYSQGGHAGMAFHRLLEEELSDQYTVAAASHMSGPYSISEKMIDFTLGDDEYGFSAYLASTYLSMKVGYPDLLEDIEVEDIFKPDYADDVIAYANEEITLWQLNTRLENQMTADVGAIIPKEMIYPEIVDAIKNDPTHPMSVALADNDVYDWAPQAPTRLMYCTADDQVFFENALLADSVMNANGAFDTFSQQQGEDLDHGGCVTPAVTGTLFFFLERRLLPSSTEDLFDIPLTQMSGTQFGNSLQIKIDERNLELENPQFILSDIHGKILTTQAISSDLFTVELNNTAGGIYLMNLASAGRVIETGKIFIRK